ncbi:MAG: 16S rRNA (cytosine(967)-C(5))-methyltransferase RsmB [Sinobacteraceae bacterium]|nr:16S rRNA (cytosine(967)-C(5))-methyltransferase RsmB [Nevskiaceae bacterium]
MAERSRWAPGAAALADAARIISAVAFDGRSTEDVLRAYDESPQRAAIRAIALGSLRWYLRLAPATEALLSHPQGVANEVRALLVVSAHQIEYSRNAPQATAHAAVDATRILAQGRASGLVNAVLRRFVAERATLLGRVDQTLAGRTAHPVWLAKLLEQAWPELHESVLAANNEHPPLVLRVDLSRRRRAAYIEELAAAEIAATAMDWAPAAVRLERPVPVPALPGFREGWVSVQDAGAQLAAKLLDAQSGMRVMDACAAPGGKTGHLLEHTPDLAELSAIDVDAERVARIDENLRRLGRRAHVQVADVREPATFWDGRPFDRILVDAPCSSTGVIRRHPDIKLLRRPADIPSFAALQEQILRAAFGMLAVGGRLVYCTCSVLPQENEEVLERLLSSDPTARVAKLPTAGSLVPGAVDKKIGIQLIPGSRAGTDGFYYACLEKTTPGT